LAFEFSALEGAMGYAEKNLVPGETLVYKTGWHWIVVGWSVLVGLILCGAGIALLVGAGPWMGTNTGGEYKGLLGIGAGGVVCGMLVIVRGMILRAATEMAVSNKRVLIKTGCFSRKSTEVLLTKIESIGVEETLMGRILGYGTVVIRGTGGTFETFDEVRKPNEFRRQVQAQLSGGTA
jgi:uncharacterized membrane protein YdbT with pleckstrin-like domain